MDFDSEEQADDFSIDSHGPTGEEAGSGWSFDDDTLLADEIFVHGLLQYNHDRDEVRIRERLEKAFIAIDQDTKRRSSPGKQLPLGRRLWLVAFSTGIAAAILGMFIFWGSDRASAGLVTLDKIIEASKGRLDQTYRILVAYEYEPVRLPRNASSLDRRTERASSDEHRPPKPSLNNAILHVREGNQFVLVRQDSNGKPFITGSDGKTSWAVRSEGPVRVSADLNRFNRDLPGHESSIPLTNIRDSLQRLRQAYEVQLVTADTATPETSGGNTLHTLIATRRPKERGPKRVEIAFDSSSEQIQHMRFIEMPYGPARLDLYMTLIDERPLSRDFFHHQSHHSRDRTVLVEE